MLKLFSFLNYAKTSVDNSGSLVRTLTVYKSKLRMRKIWRTPNEPREAQSTRADHELTSALGRSRQQRPGSLAMVLHRVPIRQHRASCESS